MSLGEPLLTWYRRHRRPLPWRGTRDAYRILVSEIMLQQTRVSTVLPFYSRFMERFPTVEELAAAEIDQVLALWSGLGYYRRARMLHGAAREIAAGGQGFPESAAALAQLPGIGPYTAAAVASMAFGERVPVLDGNVERVLSRFLALDTDPRRKAGRDALLETAATLLDPLNPGDSNQALMELGATVCWPRRPRCLLCPLVEGCQGARSGDPESFPRPRPKRSRIRVLRLVAVVEHQGKFLLIRRPEKSELLAGTWEFPWVERRGRAAPETALGRIYGGRWRLGKSAIQVRHSITFRTIDLEVRRAEVSASLQVAEESEAGWFTTGEIQRLPVSSMVGKVLRAATRIKE